MRDTGRPAQNICPSTDGQIFVPVVGKNRISAKENGPRDVGLSRREKLLRRTIK